MSIAWNSIALAMIAAGSMVASGCSDPVPPPPQGAVSYSMSRGNSQDCRITPHPANAPEAPTGTGTTVTGKRAGAVAIDGENGAKVACRVAAAGSAFGVTATITTNNVSFALTGNVAERQDGANVTVNLQDQQTLKPYLQPVQYPTPGTPPCKVSVRADANNSAFGVASGRIYGSFVCDQIRNTSTGDTCTAEGTFTFENCEE